MKDAISILKLMSTDQVVDFIKNIKNGRMARISYATELPVKAAYKNLGYRVYKVVQSTVRFGCKYSNLGAVIAKKSSKNSDSSEKKTTRKDNYEWTVPDKICHNTSTGKDYVRFAPMNNGGSHKKCDFILEIEGASNCIKFTGCSEVPESIKMFVQDSYLKEKVAPDVQNVLLENVLFVK